MTNFSDDRLRALKRMNGIELRRVLSGDGPEALNWIRTAAEHGLPYGQLRWGELLMAQSPALALHWFIEAARAGNGEAMNKAGLCCQRGIGTSVDLPRAAHWYRRSAEAGHEEGAYNYAHMLLHGIGTPCDRQEALIWYRRAADRGHALAMTLLARCHEEGWGCDKNPDQAAHWHWRSAEASCLVGPAA